MAIVLKTDEMLMALYEIDKKLAASFIHRVTELSTELADVIANHLGISAHGANFDLGEVMAAFCPKAADQPAPDLLTQFDPDGDWEMAATNGYAHG
jgi:hypothetical protein